MALILTFRPFIRFSSYHCRESFERICNSVSKSIYYCESMGSSLSKGWPSGIMRLYMTRGQEELRFCASADNLFYGKLHIVIITMAAKRPFVSIQYYHLNALDQGGTPLCSSPMTPSIHWGITCQDWSRGLEVTSRQPKGAKLSISKIANYNSSWIFRFLRWIKVPTVLKSKY